MKANYTRILGTTFPAVIFVAVDAGYFPVQAAVRELPQILPRWSPNSRIAAIVPDFIAQWTIGDQHDAAFAEFRPVEVIDHPVLRFIESIERLKRAKHKSIEIKPDTGAQVGVPRRKRLENAPPALKVTAKRAVVTQTDQPGHLFFQCGDVFGTVFIAVACAYVV
ncbi:MAG: hypothetical protein V3U60_11080 [Gammaproteobacteria bacterium]